MKKAIILVLTNFFILTLILLGKPAKAQTTEITGQFLYGLELYVLPEQETNPDYTHAIYSATITDTDFITSGLYKNWLQPYLPSGINGYVYIVDSTHTISNVRLGGGYLEQGQILPFSYEPYVDMKHYGSNFIDRFRLNPVNNILFESYGGNLEYILYYEYNDGSTPRTKLIDATTNINDYNRVKEAINGYDVGYQNGYNMGYQNGTNSGYNDGFSDGENNGYNVGYNVGEVAGYNEGYHIGYQKGLDDAAQPVYIQVQNYNQLIRNGDFASSQYWTPLNFDINEITYINNTATLNATVTGAGGIYISLLNGFNNTHKYYWFFYLWSNEENGGYVHIRYPYQSTFRSINNYKTRINGYYNGQTLDNANVFFIQLNYKENYIYYIQNVCCIDLTIMYGEGEEPTAEQCETIFISQYYPYSTGEILNINYLDGLNDGKIIGFEDGVSYQATQQLTSDGWIQNIFTGISAFLGIQILPGVSIGLIVGIPFIITVAWFVLKMARGGSSE